MILNIIQLIIQVGFWATPLIWDPNTLSPKMQMIVKINPMYYICIGYRETFSESIWFWEHPGETIYFWIFTLVMMLIGAYVFYKLRPQFADLL